MDLVTTSYSASAVGGAWTVTYREPSGIIELSFELGIAKPILWVPTEEEWEAKMPDWAKGRRDEIIDRVIESAFGFEGVTKDNIPGMY
jgi:hypothetical protein